MGYHRPVSSFNIGKQGEHRERRFFREEQARPQPVGPPARKSSCPTAPRVPPGHRCACASAASCRSRPPITRMRSPPWSSARAAPGAAAIATTRTCSRHAATARMTSAHPWLARHAARPARRRRVLRRRADGAAGAAGAIAAVRALGFMVGLHTARRLSAAARVTCCRASTGSGSTSRRRRPTTVSLRVSPAADAPRSQVSIWSPVAAPRTRYAPPCTPRSTPPEALERLARELAERGIQRWVLQVFRASGCASESVVAAASRNAALDPATLERLSEYVPVIEVRG